MTKACANCSKFTWTKQKPNLPQLKKNPPTRNAETWINMLKILNETGMAMEYNAGKVVEEAIRSMGVSDLDQFKISKEQSQEGMTPSQQMMMLEKMRGASVQPQGNIEDEVKKGNLVPMKEGRNEPK